MKAQRGKQEAGPSRREEWKLLYFIFKKKKGGKKRSDFSTAIVTMTQFCHLYHTRPEHLQD